MKILINGDVGCFCLSEAAWRLYRQLTHSDVSIDADSDPRTLQQRSRGIRRDDPRLIQVVTQLGKAANGPGAYLEIVDAPDEGWTIIDVAGIESVVRRRPNDSRNDSPKDSRNDSLKASGNVEFFR